MEELCLCFRDWQKAFDHVDYTKLMGMIKNIETNWREHQLKQFIHGTKNGTAPQSSGNRQHEDLESTQIGMFHATQII